MTASQQGRTPFSDTGQLALHYLRYVIAVKVAGAWDRFGGMGEMITNLAHMMELSVGPPDSKLSSAKRGPT